MSSTHTLREEDVYLPANERRKVIARYGASYKIDTMVETGTNLGHTPLALRGNFKTIYTIELFPRLHREAVRVLKPYPHIVCLRGDSLEKLPIVLNKLRAPALFWLDGHYSGPETGKGETDTPVKEEIEMIFENVLETGYKHVILVDDARLFGGGLFHTEEFKDYPSLAWVSAYSDANGYKYELKDDIIRLTPPESINVERVWQRMEELGMSTKRGVR